MSEPKTAKAFNSDLTGCTEFFKDTVIGPVISFRGSIDPPSLHSRVFQILAELNSQPMLELPEFKLRQYLNAWWKEFGNRYEGK
jgi:hypothetical protein